MLTLKTIHLGLVILSVSFFIFRFAALQLNAPLMQQRWMRIAPHMIDTLLLASGIALAVGFHISPLRSHWLLAKLVLIVGYILLGILAFRAKNPRRAIPLALLALVMILGAALMAIYKPL